MDFLSIQTYLQELSHKQGLVELAIQSCWQCIDSRIEEDGLFAINGYPRQELRLMFDEHAFVFNNNFGQELLVHTRIRIGIDDTNGVWLNRLIPLGTYTLETNEAGEEVDDWLLLNDKLKREINTVYFVKNLNKHLPLELVHPDSAHYHYVSLIHQAIAFYQSDHYSPCTDFILRAFAYIQALKFSLEWQAYMKSSKRILKMLAIDLVQKRVIPDSVMQELVRRGIVKQEHVG